MQKPNIYLFPQLSDNYGYLIKLPHAKEAAIVDPSDLEMCEKILHLNDCSLSHILLTHHHDDHTAAVNDLKKKYNSKVIGHNLDDKLPNVDISVKADEEISIFDNTYKIISTPGHTMQHICYFNKDFSILFAGDTLFSLGCGRMFEGTPELFWKSLKILKRLPKETLVYCGHEYTYSNLLFALSIDPENKDLSEHGKWIKKQCVDARPTLPTKLQKELNLNPFLRCDNEVFKKLYNSDDPIEVFSKMRSAKDNF
jgi:hydroxyacylglutathione hydrolase|tara:strand:+ start:806 stop:1567 length:762 start_codon:yes stop_codon:yes gene_type:complete